MEGEDTNYVSFMSGNDGGYGNNNRVGGRSRPTVFNAYTWRKKFGLKRKNIIYIIIGASIAVSVLICGYMILNGSSHNVMNTDSAAYKPEYMRNDVEFPKEIHLWKESHFLQSFDIFMKEHGKSYKSLEHKKERYSIFKANTYYIHKHNEQRDFGSRNAYIYGACFLSERSYTLGMSKFGDMTKEEFAKHYGLNRKFSRPQTRLGVDNSLLNVKADDIPSEIDWRQKGCVTPVKDQGSCGSCWAFSSTGSLEGTYCAKTGKLLSLSEQQLMDCSKYEGNESCNGGLMDLAFDYVSQHGGLCTEQDYPYEAVDHTSCKESSCKKTFKIKGFYDVPHDENALKAAIAQKGPVSIAINASNIDFMFYKDGVFDGECSTEMNHGVLAVGYGTDKELNKDFFTVKNSWGTGWGDKGYIRIAQHMGSTGECGLLLMDSYPLIDDV